MKTCYPNRAETLQKRFYHLTQNTSATANPGEMLCTASVWNTEAWWEKKKKKHPIGGIILKHFLSGNSFFSCSPSWQPEPSGSCQPGRSSSGVSSISSLFTALLRKEPIDAPVLRFGTLEGLGYSTNQPFLNTVKGVIWCLSVLTIQNAERPADFKSRRSGAGVWQEFISCLCPSVCGL